MITSVQPNEFFLTNTLLFKDGSLQKVPKDILDYEKYHLKSKNVIGCWKLKHFNLKKP